MRLVPYTGKILLMICLIFGLPLRFLQAQVNFDPPWTSAYQVDTVYRYQFINHEGNHLFLLNKTLWAYFACEHPGAVLRKARQEGVNVIRVCLEGTPYEKYLHLDLWPWDGTREKPAWNAFNEKYWSEVESRIKLAGEYGIGIDLVLYFTLKPGSSEVNVQKNYWDHAIHHLSKYSNLFAWEIMNEEPGHEAFQDSAGMYFKRHDPFHHLVFSSAGTTDDAFWPWKSWVDVAIVHTCTGNQPGYDLKSWYLDIARNTRQYSKPAFNNESGREKRHKNDDPVFRRKQSWLWTTAGAFWTWHSWEGCEGINDTLYFGPGWKYLKPLREFYNELPFWEMSPNYTALNTASEPLVSTTLSTPDRNYTVMYCCTRKTAEVSTSGSVSVRLPDGEYSVSFLNPADLTLNGHLNLKSVGLRNTGEFKLPVFTDDLLIVIRKTKKTTPSIMEGTR